MNTPRELYGRPWSEPEYLIVLHYYYRHHGQSRHSSCEYIKDVADILGRTAGAVSMRMENYASIDPELAGQRTGLSHINRFGKKLFDYWSPKREALAETAEAFLRDLKSRNAPTLFNPGPVRMPRAFDRYELVDQIGEGGTGVVFSCIDALTQKLFAMKIIRTDRIYDDEAISRFRREIRILKSISCDSVIKLHEDNLETEKNFPAFVMDFASDSLTSYFNLKQGGERPVLPSQEAKRILDSCFAAISALHMNSPKLIHRDLNPNNLLYVNSKWVLADFGLAKFIGTAPLMTSFQTNTQRGMGTQWYTAPEQYRDFKDVDQRADIYSLGILIWELFTSTYPPPELHNLELPRRLQELVQRACSRDRDCRFSSIQEMQSDFEIAFAELIQ